MKATEPEPFWWPRWARPHNMFTWYLNALAWSGTGQVVGWAIRHWWDHR